MPRFKVTREITVKVYDYVNANDWETAKVAVNDMPGLLTEVARGVGRGGHAAVVYKDYTEKIENTEE